ncbi:MAG: 5'-nucleotidase C-terminal domain-containing protein, partial [Deltaproteobacteria bacterium]
YVSAVRAARARDHGGVLLLDAGDLFQGTLASNLLEGAPVIAAYNALGYDAVAIGNHDFDYGSLDSATPGSPGATDPRGALLARAAEARFPFLTANVLDAHTHARVRWPHVAPSARLEVAGVSVVVIGVTTAATLSTTLFANVRDLAMDPPLEAILAESARARRDGATLVIVAAHAGGRCSDLTHAGDASSCDPREEIVQVANALPAGAVDAIVAGHTHQAMANVIHDVPVLESWALGRAFGRIDFEVDPVMHRVLGRHVFPPRDLCVRMPTAAAPCETTPYEGQSIAADPRVAALVAPALSGARVYGDRAIGVTLASRMRTVYDREAPLGNLLADLLRDATPGADVAVLNGGGIRADLPAGPVTYGSVYEVMPFDNRVAMVRMRGAGLRALVAENLAQAAGIVSLGGVRVRARCVGGALDVTLHREDGTVIADDTPLTVVTSDFLVSGGDGMFHDRIERDVTGDAPLLLRDVFAAGLTARGAAVHSDDARVFDAASPRIAYPGARPLRCGGIP